MSISKVLLVDDVPANLLALQVMLASVDCELVLANSGIEALRELLQHDFAAVLLDLHMPTMNGMEVARLIRSRERSSNIPILFVTASDISEFPVEEAYAVGAIDYLSKPVNAFVLRSKVKFFVELYNKNLELLIMQQALHSAEMKITRERTHVILENAKGYAVIETTCDGIITGWGAGASEITGWKEMEVLGKEISLLFTTDDLATDRPSIERSRALSTGRATDQRWHVRKDGSRFFADGVTVVVYDNQNKPQSLTKLFQDATDRVRGEIERDQLLKEVQAANMRLADVFEQAPAFLCTLAGPQHRLQMANDRYYQLIDKTPAILGMTVSEYFPEAAAQGFLALLDNVYRTGESFVGTGVTLKLRQADGSYADRIVDFVYVALRDPDGVITGVFAHGVDMTERTRYEVQAREADSRYRKVIASMDEGFCLIDMIVDTNGKAIDYRFLEVNSVFSQQTGLGDDAVGKTMLELVPDIDSVWIEKYGRVARTGEAIRFTEEARAMNRWFDVYATPMGPPGGSTVALLFSDITARRKVDESLRHLAAELSEASRRKSEFLAVLAHELRNPLAPIRTGLSLMQMSADKPAVVNRVREMMERQLSHMVHLIDGLLDVARISRGKVELQRERVRLDSVLQTAIETAMPIINSSSHTFTSLIPDEEIVLSVDPVRIAQVVSNLLMNAAKYTPRGGAINLAAQRRGNSVAVAVSDNGMGIPAEALSSVFDMFSQVSRNLGRAQGGLGIGLSIVKQLVELHDGSVEVMSAGADGGSTFTVILPLASTPSGSAEDELPMPRSDSDTTPTFKILVADDNIDAANTLAAVLELLNHEVMVAHDGTTALATAYEKEPDIAFLDIGMPGLTGLEVASAIRSHGNERMLLVALTGWGGDEDRLSTRAAGFNHHLAKPVPFDALEGLIRSVEVAENRLE